MPLFTGGCLQEFRRSQLVGWTTRSGGREILHRTMCHVFVEAFDDHRIAGRLLQLRKTDDHAKADEQHQDEDCTRGQSRESADYQLLNFVCAHAPSASFGLAGGTSYMTRPRRTSSMASRSAFFG